MPLIDDRGRVFGRFNMVDALALLLLAAAIPGGYVAHLMFRAPRAQLIQVVPAVINQGVNQQVEVTGRNFRPYMRVSFGGVQGASFLYYGATQAFVPLPALEPGTYDVVLYDYMREVGRLPQALTVTGPAKPATVQVTVMGAFTGQPLGQPSRLAVGQTLYGAGGLVALTTEVGAPRPSVARVRVSEVLTVPVTMDEWNEVPATLTLTCPTELAADGILRCATGGIVLAPDVNIMLRGPDNQLPFRVDRIDDVAARPR